TTHAPPSNPAARQAPNDRRPGPGRRGPGGRPVPPARDGPAGATAAARNLSFGASSGAPVTAGSMARTESDGGRFAGSGHGVAPRVRAGNDDAVGRMRGWPVSLIEPALLDAPVGLRPVRVRDARVWRDSRVRNAAWLRPWEPTNPETPLYRSGLGPYVTMARTMRREARQGLALPWVVTY